MIELEEILETEFIKEKLSEFRELTDEEYQTEIGSEEMKEDATGSYLADNEYGICSPNDQSAVLDKAARPKKKQKRDVDKALQNCISEKELLTINYEGAPSVNLSEETRTPTLDWVQVDDSLDSEISEEELKVTSLKTSIEVMDSVSLTLLEDKTAIKVKFTTKNGKTMTSHFRVVSKIRDLKKRIAEVFKVPANCFDLFQGKLECEDSMPLSDFIVCSEEVEFFIKSRDDRVYDPDVLFSRYRPDKKVLNARIPLDIGGTALKTVYIENQCFVKEWLGGYRNKKTKLEYHHAMSQTLPKRRDPWSLSLFSRATNTRPEKEIGTQIGHDKATQMWRPDYYSPCVDDRIVKTDPNRFESGRLLGISKQNLGTTIEQSQTYYKPLSNTQTQSIEDAEKRKCLPLQMSNEARRQMEQLVRNKRLIIDSTFPVKREDFYQLHLLIAKWWKESYNRIKKTKCGAALKAALPRLLEKEIDFIKLIERKRVKVKRDTLVKQNLDFLETCARPIIFRDKNGVMSSLDTLDTIQAREIMEMASSYMNPFMDSAQRIDTISTLTTKLQENGEHEFTKEVIDLLQRELDLITMGLEMEEMHFLRTRILQLVFTRLRSPTVNPSSVHYRRPCMPKTDFKTYKCIYCGKFKHACDYTVHMKLTAFDICTSCTWIHNTGQDRINFTPYARMLSDVRQSEMSYCCSRSCCFLLQPVGMYYLVRRIWLGQSILSSKSDMNRLRIVRFRKEENWSPWNCILLTVEESVIHLALEDVLQFYNKGLLDVIHWRLLKGRDHFMPLLLNDRFMDESKLWSNVQDTGRFLHPSHVDKFARNDDFEITE